MKIGNITGNSNINTRKTGGIKKTKEKKTEKKVLSTSVSEDIKSGEERTQGVSNLQIEEKVKVINKIKEEVKKAEDPDEKVVEELRDKIAKGEYNVDVEKLADSLIDNGVIDVLMRL